MELEYPDVVQWAVPLFIAAIAIELTWIVMKGRGGRYETHDAVTSLIMSAGNVASGILLGFLTWGFFMTLWAITPLDLGTSVWVVLACFGLDDLRYYWVQRFGHRTRWVWASHVKHHSSQHYNLTTALRQTWTGTFTFKMVLSAPLILLGFHPAMVLFVGGLNLIYQFWIHTETIGKMPRWFEAVTNTPRITGSITGAVRVISTPIVPGFSSSGSSSSAPLYRNWRTSGPIADWCRT